MKLSSTSGIILLVLVMIGGLIGLAVYQNVGPSKYDEFAQCLSENDAFVYEAWWCSACQRQKEEFGSAYRFVNKKECAPAGQSGSLALCQEDGITATPTWRLPDGSLSSGFRTLEDLAATYGCELPE